MQTLPQPTSAEETLHRFAITRPARFETEEIEALKGLAGNVSLGNTRPDFIKNHIDVSNDTLRGEATWDDGLAFFATHLHQTGESLIVGSCKLQNMEKGCWGMKTSVRTAHGKNHRSEIPILRYDAADLNAVEFAGNVVGVEFRGQGLGRLHVEARVLYIHMHTERIKKGYVVANLLPPRGADGLFPFYQHVLRELTADHKSSSDEEGAVHARPISVTQIEYDQADTIRYSQPKFYQDLLGVAESHPEIQFPVCVLPAEIQGIIGRVREETLPAQRVLQDYGFESTREVYQDKLDRYDLLDLGLYIATPIHRLKRRLENHGLRKQTARVVPDKRFAGAIGANMLCTYAPRSSDPLRFVCVRSQVVMVEDEIVLPQTVASAAEIVEGCEVLVLAPGGRRP